MAENRPEAARRWVDAGARVFNGLTAEDEPHSAQQHYEPGALAAVEAEQVGPKALGHLQRLVDWGYGDNAPDDAKADWKAAREYLTGLGVTTIITLTDDERRRVAPYLLNPRFDYAAARYECDPSSTEPDEIRAACIAEKLLNA